MAQHAVILYALSTCIHCRHAKEFLEKNNIDFECTYVDKLGGEERSSALEAVRAVNPRLSFPTMIVGPSRTVIIGLKPHAITEALAP